MNVRTMCGQSKVFGVPKYLLIAISYSLSFVQRLTIRLLSEFDEPKFFAGRSKRITVE